MAVNERGSSIYLITNQGLTVIDLGEAPLSIGWLNLSTVSPGSLVTVRGSGFEASTAATVNGKAATVNFTDSNTLTLTIPSVSSGPATIVLRNPDGKSYTLAGLLTIQ